MSQAVDIDDGRARIPSTAFEHQGFRAWARTGDLPAGVMVSFIAGEVLIEMSPESTESHNKPKTKVTAALDRLITERDLGEGYSDRTLLTNVEAELSTEPDFLFVSGRRSSRDASGSSRKPTARITSSSKEHPIWWSRW